MTSRPAGTLLLLAAAALAAAPAARAESRPEEDVTPLSLVRRADLVLVGAAVAPDAAPPREGLLGSLRAEEVLRGLPVGAGTAVEVAGDPSRTDARLPAAGTRCVAFLVRRPDGALEPLGGAHGIAAVGEAPPGLEEPVLALLRVLAAETDAAGRLERPSRVREALVRAAAAPGRLQSGAALDLLREPGLLDGVTGPERDLLVAGFDAARSADRARSHLARLLGRLAPEGAAARLVDSLLAEDGDPLRSAAGRALGDLGDEAAIRLLAGRTAGADAARRARAAAALGWSGAAAARSPLEALLGAAEPAVRLEACIALGRLRAAVSAPALLRRLRGVEGGPAAEGEPAVRRALLWALAQADAPDAWEALRGVAAAADDRDRRFAADLLRNPRVPFVP
jgi:HEAT repeat protein